MSREVEELVEQLHRLLDARVVDAAVRDSEGRVVTGKRLVRPLITVPILATFLGMSERTVRRWDAAGLLPRGFKVQGKRLWSIDEIAAWLERHRYTGVYAEDSISAAVHRRARERLSRPKPKPRVRHHFRGRE